MSDAVLCCIAKHEDRYLPEWIEYHLALGFSHVYIYDNSDEGGLAPLHRDPVSVVHWPGPRQQMPAYNHMLAQHSLQHRWCAFLDVDEFLVLRRHRSVVELLKQHCPSGGLCLNWYVFGSSGHLTYEARPVRERFQMRQAKLDQHVKSIVTMADAYCFSNPHYAHLRPGYLCVDTAGRTVTGPYNPEGTDHVACIHHYFTKSEEEFLEKRARGRADTGTVRSIRDFARHDHNDVRDSSAWDWRT
jgi:hypothetical protein